MSANQKRCSRDDDLSDLGWEITCDVSWMTVFSPWVEQKSALDLVWNHLYFPSSSSSLIVSCSPLSPTPCPLDTWAGIVQSRRHKSNASHPLNLLLICLGGRGQAGEQTGSFSVNPICTDISTLYCLPLSSKQNCVLWQCFLSKFLYFVLSLIYNEKQF